LTSSEDLIVTLPPVPEEILTSLSGEPKAWSLQNIGKTLRKMLGPSARTAERDFDFESVRFPNLSDPLNQIHLGEAWQQFSVSGSGITVAVIDSGCRGDHEGFEDENEDSRVVSGISFTGTGNNTSDDVGHGTSVAGVIASANDIGVAPGAKILPLKVFGATSDRKKTLERVVKALEWIVENGKSKGISIVNLSVGNRLNYENTSGFPADLAIIARAMETVIQDLRDIQIPVIVASGNFFKRHKSEVGMSFPGILPNVISVGAVHSSKDESGESYPGYDGAQIIEADKDIIAPFTQRLPKNNNVPFFTTLVAPGAPVKSSWHTGSTHYAPKIRGTSIAAPMVTGVIALMQERNIKKFGVLPSCAEIESWLELGATSVHDMQGAHDNVDNTDKDFPRLDALGALQAMDDRTGAGT